MERRRALHWFLAFALAFGAVSATACGGEGTVDVEDDGGEGNGGDGNGGEGNGEDGDGGEVDVDVDATD